jgi:PleD family two-component response regulator
VRDQAARLHVPSLAIDELVAAADSHMYESKTSKRARAQ